MKKSPHTTTRSQAMPRRGTFSALFFAAALCGCAHKPCPPPTPPTPPAPCPAAKPAAAPAKKPTLVLSGAPEIPDALKRRLSQYLNTRSAYLGDLSADGKAMLVTTRFGQTSQVHLLRTPLGARSQLTFAAEPSRRPTFTPGEGGRSLVYASDVGGNERYQLFRLDLKGGRTTLLTDGKSRHGSYAWSRDGKRLAYTSNARNGKDMDIYLGDGRDPAAGKLLLERQGHWLPLEWSPDNKLLLLMHYVSINDSRLHLLDLASKKVTRVSPEAPRAAYRSARFAADGRHMFVATDREGEFVELFRVDLAGKKWKPLSRKLRWNVEGMDLSPDGRTLAFSVNAGGPSELHLLDTRKLTHRKAPGLPPGIIKHLRFAREANVLGFSITSAIRSGDAYSYDLKRRRLTRWTASEVGGLNPARFVEPALIKYKSFDGRQIPAFYYRPAGAGPHPVLVYIHGGPESQARPRFSAVIQYLASESGVAVLVPNVRGSDGYGKSYLLLDNGFKREDSVKDIGALLDWVAGQKELDAKRIGVLGGSYGGYMVLAALTHFADRIVAGVDVVGISNFVTFLTNTKAYRRDLRRAEYGDERDPKMNAFLQRISPSNQADKIRSALFVAHGANDPRVPLSETDQLVAAVKKQGKDVWYMVANNEGHGFRKKKNRDTFWQLSVLFFEKHLK